MAFGAVPQNHHPIAQTKNPQRLNMDLLSVIAFGLGNGVGGLGVEINVGITYIIVQKNVQVGLVYGRLRMMRKTGQKTTRNNIKMYIDHIRDLTPPVIQFQNIELVRTRDQEGEVFGIELEKRYNDF